MFVGFAGLLIAAAPFITEPPAPIVAQVTSTNAVSGTFTTEKTLGAGPGAKRLQTEGRFEMRPGDRFVWETLRPFAAKFVATARDYVYENEDETVRRALKDLPGYSRFAGVAQGDFSAVMKSFDTLFKTDADGTMHLLSKPKVSELKRVLDRVEIDGDGTNWTVRAVFPNGTSYSIRISGANPTGK